MLNSSGACGYVLAIEGGSNVYFTGDSGVFGDMKLVADLYAPQFAVVPVGGKYNLGVKGALVPAHLVRPGVFILMHYGTFLDQQANLARLRDLL